MPVSDLDIWRAAKLLIEQRGKKAAMDAAQRSNDALRVGDKFNYELWQRICMSILDLQRRKVLDGESVH